jgi:hypothetical protein
MKKILKSIKKFGNTIVTNKRNIGIGILLVNQGLKAFFPDLMTPEQSNWIDGVGLTIGGVGMAHDAGRKVNNNIAKATKNKKK